MNTDTFLFQENKSSSKLVVVFSGFHAINFMGYKLLEKYNFNKLFIRDPNQSWYNKKITALCEDADELKLKIETITTKFDKENIIFIGSSMGGYAALLFGALLNIHKILVFGPQVKLNPNLPNNPQTLQYIKYPDLSEIIQTAENLKIEYFFGMEEITDFYHIQNISNLPNVNIHCVINSPHNVMKYFSDINMLDVLLNSFLMNDSATFNILEANFWRKNNTLASIINVLNNFQNNSLNRAIEELLVILEDVLNWSGGWLFLARLYRETKQFQLSLEASLKSVTLNSRSDLAHHELAVNYFAFKRYDEAIIHFNYAIIYSSKPKVVDLIKLTISYREIDDLNNAYKTATLGKQLYPGTFSFYFHIGKILELKHNYKASKSYYQRAYELAPKNKVLPESINNIELIIKKKNNNITSKILFCGDTILTRNMHFYYEHFGLEWITSDLKKLIDEIDCTVLNLECVISNKGKLFPKKEYRPFHYRGSPELTNILTTLNVKVALTANNHTMDFGHDALLEQKKYFKEIGILTPGSGENISEAMQPEYININDTTVAIISIFTFSDKDVYSAQKNKAGVFQVTEEKLILNYLYQAFLEAKQKADIVIVSPHWTQNWTIEPTVKIKNLAHKMIDLGFDAIVGHSSHLIHGIELYKNHPIIYDTGTFLADFAKGHEEMPFQAAFMLHIQEKSIVGLEIIPILLKNGKTILATKDDAKLIKKNIKNRTKLLDDSIEFVNQGNRLFLEFKYEKQLIEKKNSFPLNSKSSFYINKLHEWENQKPNIVSLNEPMNHKLKYPIKIKGGASITHIDMPECFYRGTGFLIKFLFQLSTGYKNNRYDIHICGLNKEENTKFYVQYPISQGVYNPVKWESNETLIDETVIRPFGNLKAGIYKCYFAFKDQNLQENLHTIDNRLETYNDMVYIGEIVLLDELRKNYASGLDWSGMKNDI